MSEHSAQWFRTALTQIVSAWPTMLDASSSGGAVGGERNPSRPPVSIEVLSLRQEVTAWLASMCLLVIQERELDTRSLDGNDVPLMCRWLEPHVEWVIEHEAGEAFTEELQAWARQVVRMVEEPEVRGMKLGVCPQCQTDLYCKDPQASVACRGCGLTHDVAGWMGALGLDGFVTDKQAALVLCTQGRMANAALVRKWAERGRITKYERGGRVLYDAEEIKRLAVQEEMGVRVVA